MGHAAGMHGGGTLLWVSRAAGPPPLIWNPEYRYDTDYITHG